MIEGFGFKEQYQGTGDTTDYSFDFKVFDPSHLHLYIQDQYGNILADTDGNDPIWVSSVTINSDGGGILSLAAVLQNAYILSIFLANDYPDQPTVFPDKTSFTLPAIEGALDFLAACIQRAAYLAQRSIRLHDLDDVYSFDMRLPYGLSANPGAFLVLNDAGNGWAIGPTYASLLAAVNAATAAALLSETEAAAAASGADAALAQAQASAASAAASSSSAGSSATAAAASAALAASFSSGILHSGPFAAIAPNANLDLPGEITDHTVNTMIDYVARIRRGTTVHARQEFSIFYRNGAWEKADASDRYADAASDHGVTFTVNSATGQINAAVANDGGSNAVIDLYKIGWAV